MVAPTFQFLDHLRTPTAPLALPRKAVGPVYADADLHWERFRADPELYGLCGAADRVAPGQAARMLYQLLAVSWQGFAADIRRLLNRVVRHLLARLEPQAALTVCLALRRARANHRHTRRAILGYLLNHPHLEALAAARRPAVVDALEHALGRDVARGCARKLAEAGPADPYVRRNLLTPLVREPERVAKVVAFLYGRGPCPEGAPLPAVLAEEAPAPPKTVTATNRGDIAATLVHVYRGGTNRDLAAALERYVAEEAARLPFFDGTLALVLDASASTQSYGEREYACLAQAQALRLVLAKCCRGLRVVTVGGAGDPPRPEGDTDLAAAVLDALDGDPELVAVVSDGYENVAGGDLARVAASLPGAGITTPVVFCHSTFTGWDDLTLRRPAPALPELSFWHQKDFADLCWGLFARARAPLGEAFLRGQLARRLDAGEAEGRSWVTN